jgi:ketosteroid isomerase-like protein
MILRKSTLGLAAVAALSGCSQMGSNPGTMDEVRRAALGVVAAYNAQDAHAAAAYDAPDYVGIYHGSPNTVGPAADEAAMKSQAAAGHVDWQLGDAKVTVSKAGDLGIYEAPYTFTVTNPDKSVTRETGNWIAIFRRQDDGSFKLWRSIASDTPSPKPAGAA